MSQVFNKLVIEAYSRASRDHGSLLNAAAGSARPAFAHYRSNKRVDELEAVLRSAGEAPAPVRHTFTPGLYVRELTMPANYVAVSKIHKTTHPFTISKGRVWVWTEGEGWAMREAPYSGVTTPCTRRIFRTETETVWSTYHPITPDEHDRPDLVEARIIHPGSDALDDITSQALNSFGDASCRSLQQAH